MINIEYLIVFLNILNKYMKLGGYLALLLVLSACQEKKISSSNVLIPLIYDDASSRKIEFNVHAYNGCY